MEPKKSKLSGKAEALQARQLLENVGARATHPRLRVLSILLWAQMPLSHLEVLKEIDQPIDRVTVYRILEWLAEVGIAHKITADDRTFRFSVVEAQHCHAHFHCELCHKVFCLDAMSLNHSPKLPVGFHFHSLEMTVRGVCSSCTEKIHE